MKGLTISITTTARSDFEGLTLLRALGMPFRGAPSAKRAADGSAAQQRRAGSSQRGTGIGSRMAKTCLRVKATRKHKFKVRQYNRCPLCGRARAYYRRFKMCRLCLRKYALDGKLPGVIKASW